MEEVKYRKILTPRLIVLLVILAVGIVGVLYIWLVYVPYMRDMYDEINFGFNFEELDLDGDGSVQSPYQIKTPEDLANLSEKVKNGSSYAEKYFVLMNDIDMSEFLSEGGAGYNDGAGWFPIGTTEHNAFSGVFDGVGYTVSGIWINRPELSTAGLFGLIKNADIYRLNVESVNIIAKNETGALAGRIQGGKIINCTAANVEALTNAKDYYKSQGMLIGLATGGVVIENCSSAGSLSAVTETSMYLRVGGLIGTMTDKSVLRNSSSIITIKVQAENIVSAGGLVGSIYSENVIDNCRSEGIVTVVSGDVDSDAGGLAGYVVGEGTVIKNSSSSCKVEGKGKIGGFVGKLDKWAEITNSYATGDVACINNEYWLCGGKIGGFAGVSDNGTIKSSFAAGNIIGDSRACSYGGGFIGRQYNGIISDCFATGYVKGTFWDGGFIGTQDNESSIINCYSTGNNVFTPSIYGSKVNCYFNSETAETSSDRINVAPKTTAEMQSIETYEGWDFMSVWFMPENDYPKLRGIR
ncbi:MAG: hypothetical protein FWG70_09600 [Oscillospiraceae bacterium]|nr:hypothetical protein [Oscillospiraceae bacterium]